MSMNKDTMIDQLRSVAIEQQRIMLSAKDFWKGLAFSLARIWCEVIHPPYSDHSKIIATTLLRRAHAKLFDMPELLKDFDQELLVLLDGIHKAYEPAFKYQTISVKKPASKLALKNKWSLKTGLHYQNSETGPTEIATAVSQHRQRIIRYDNQLVSLLRSATQNTDCYVPETILQPLTADDLFGSEEQWHKYARFEVLTGSNIRKTLQSVIGPHYNKHDQAGGFSFVKRSEHVVLKLFVETSSLMAQFTYNYQITIANSEGQLPPVTFESILGVDGTGWDSIAVADKETFAEDFLHVDSVMRKSIE
jgi:hypothetical protein